jgi:hypothetical protein
LKDQSVGGSIPHRSIVRLQPHNGSSRNLTKDQRKYESPEASSNERLKQSRRKLQKEQWWTLKFGEEWKDGFFEILDRQRVENSNCSGSKTNTPICDNDRWTYGITCFLFGFHTRTSIGVVLDDQSFHHCNSRVKHLKIEKHLWFPNSWNSRHNPSLEKLQHRASRVTKGSHEWREEQWCYTKNIFGEQDSPSILLQPLHHTVEIVVQGEVSYWSEFDREQFQPLAISINFPTNREVKFFHIPLLS